MTSITDGISRRGAILQVRQERMGLIASNIANASTPGYKARDIDFEQAMTLASKGQSFDGAVQYRVPLQSSMDGNTVEMVNEQLQFSENALAYHTSLNFMKSHVQTLVRSLKGE